MPKSLQKIALKSVHLILVSMRLYSLHTVIFFYFPHLLSLLSTLMDLWLHMLQKSSNYYSFVSACQRQWWAVFLIEKTVVQMFLRSFHSTIKGLFPFSLSLSLEN